MELLRYSPGSWNPWLVRPQHIHGTQDFVEQAKKVTLQLGGCLSSYTFTALFISVPVDLALVLIKGPLEQDNTVKEKIVLPIKDIILSLGFWLHNTSFSFWGNSMSNWREPLWGALLFLDTLVKPEANYTLSITVHRKPSTQISICSGTVTTTYQQSIVLFIPLPTGQKQKNGQPQESTQ